MQMAVADGVHRHKSSDVDQFEGPVPLRSNHVEVGGLNIVFSVAGLE